MRAFKLCSLLVFLGLYAATTTFALFADQAGLNDWAKQHVGEVVHAVTEGERVLVATKQGVVASLLSKNGEFEWRRVYPRGETQIDKLLLQGDVLVTKGPRTVKAWNMNGQMLWDQVSEQNIHDAAFVDEDTVAVLTGEKLLTFTKSTGASLSKGTRDVSSIQSSRMGILVADGAPHVVHVEKTDAAFRIIVSGKDNVEPRVFTARREDFAVNHKGCIAFFKEISTVEMHCMGSSQSFEVAVPSDASSLAANDDSIYVRGPTSMAVVYSVSKDVKPRQKVLSASHVATSQASKLIEIGSDNVIKLFQGEQPIGEFRLEAAVPSIAAAWFAGTDQVLLLSSDASLRMFRMSGKSTQLVWVREEALAEVVQIVSTSFPHKVDAKADTSRLLGQITRLSEGVVSFANATIEMMRGISDAAVRVARGGDFDLKSISETSEEERARFGFNRILLFLTKKNKLFAIHSETAAILWTRILGKDFEKPTMFAIQEGDPEPHVLVLEPKTGNCVVVSAVDGRAMLAEKSITGGQRVLQTIIVESADAIRKRTLMVMDAALNIKEYPSPAKHYSTQPYFTHVLDKSKLEFTGYRITPGAKKASVAWSLVFPSDSKFVQLASTPMYDPVSSPVRPLGDGSLLVKHINPHLVGLVTSDATYGLRVHLIDTVSGRVIHRGSHKDGVEPVQAIRFENWMVYTFWNAKARRQELISMTLYEKTPINKRQLNPWTSVPTLLKANFSSFDAPEITVLQRSFLIPGQEITSLGVTATLRGIAAKNLLVSLGGTGQILMLDQRLIDPRRTAQAPTDEEKLEGLFQYQPELPLVPTHILSYYKGAGERGADLFYVAPSLLESTCTVIAAGLDIFKGRASPSGAFDLLAEDFNYMLLVLLIVTLAAVVYVLRRMERRKSLETAWA